mmetsp:Transcript_14006/g.25334  ORF Transcript_14006/g.25334 Transcript_14006/m.25334 type:complete len:102 (+) Transcript_14006:295-600(+)
MSQPIGIGTLSAQAGATAGSTTGMLGEREVVRNTGKQAIVSFLEVQTCYTVLRNSGKVVVFDTRIPIQLAFYALVEHGERLVLLFESGVALYNLCLIHVMC